ncbi:MAG: FAD-dependent oxidoreductase [Mogibacterium sp.]|nr:FAD-dependent oxidoreductase [Mogibacterium sp.]
MKKDYPKLFEPLTIKRMTIKNRVVMTPMGTNYGEPDGQMSFLHLNYYKLRARGGTGLIIVENANVDYPTGSNGTSQIRIDHDSFMPRFFKLTELIHQEGGLAAIQINHAGASASSARTGVQPVSSSNIPSKDGGEVPRPLEISEIEEIVKKYGEAAKRAQTAGFDAVEIHCGHSYLISQFLSPVYNKRTDEFGGSAENRARLAKMVIEEVRRQVGPFFPIIARISADEFVEGGNTLEDCLEYLQYFEKEVDLFNVSAALNQSLQFQIDSNCYPDGWRSYMARAVKERYGKPVITMGNIRSPKVANEILERGDADLIGIGRGLIADPEWVNKAEFGTEDDIRKCISCNIGCAGNRIGNNRPIRCTVNPSVLEGDIYKKLKVNKACNVVVIGGGTTGMETACTAAEVGCTVFLIEKEDHLGGLAVEISKFPDKNRLRDFPNYLERRIAKLHNLHVFTSTEATPEFVRALHPDIIVNSTGSLPLILPIPGLKENVNKEGGKIHTVLGVINNLPNYPDDMTGKKAVVIGGGAVGLDVVEYFAPKGADTTVIEMMPAIGAGLDPITKVSIADLMKKYDVHQRPSTALQEVRPDCFVVKNPDGSIEEVDFDYGCICMGLKSNNPVLDMLNEEFGDGSVEIMNIGDSKRQRRIIDGTEEGRNILKVLEKRGFIDEINSFV